MLSHTCSLPSRASCKEYARIRGTSLYAHYDSTRSRPFGKRLCRSEGTLNHATEGTRPNRSVDAKTAGWGRAPLGDIRRVAPRLFRVSEGSSQQEHLLASRSQKPEHRGSLRARQLEPRGSNDAHTPRLCPARFVS
jgi:hypothetical protein